MTATATTHRRPIMRKSSQLGTATRRRQLQANGARKVRPNPRQRAQRDALYDLVGKIAAMLGETERSPRGGIKLLLLALGRDPVMDLLRETLQIELHGGMMTSDGTKRRTPGGVFFALARRQYGRECRAFARAQRRQRLAKKARKSHDHLPKAVQKQSRIGYQSPAPRSSPAGQ